MKTGAQLLLDRLKSHGVHTIFGYPGATVLPVYDELPGSGITHILVRHEQAAAHAADGFARAGGMPGICLATSGPGACNLVTGIATAYMDSVPVVAVTGQVPTNLIGTDAFQEADITGITRPVTKHNYLVRRTSDLPRIIDEAFSIATSGRPGPVLIDIPKDISAGVVPDNVPALDRKNKNEKSRKKGLSPGIDKKVERAARFIMEAQKPVIYAGGGVIASGAHEEIRCLADVASIPVTTTLLGLGLMPADHPLNLGMIGMHGTVAANYAVSECDLLIAVGARFSDRACGTSGSFAPHAAVIHIDIDTAEIGKNHPADVPITGDAKEILQLIIWQIRVSRKREDWTGQITRWKKIVPAFCPDDGHLYPQFVITTLGSLLKGDAIVVSEVGQHQMWTAQYFNFSHPRSFLTSGGLGTMGFGLPASMGAYFARPDKTICLIAGDGSIQMNIQELATIAEYHIPIKICVLNNQFLGMVRQWQELFFEKRYSFTELPPVDFTRIAAAYGIRGMKVSDPEEVMPSIRKALDYNGPFLLDFRIEREENVFPMVPAGYQNHEMILEKPGYTGTGDTWQR
jgi:acetolactate synthase-1/2/3 large subunit